MNESTYTPLKSGKKGDIVYQKLTALDGTEKYKQQTLNIYNGFFVFVEGEQYGIPIKQIFTKVETEKDRNIKNAKLLVQKEIYEFNEKIQRYYYDLKECMNKLYRNLFDNTIYILPRDINYPEFYMNTSQILINGNILNKYKFKTLKFEEDYGHIDNIKILKSYILKDIGKQYLNLDTYFTFVQDNVSDLRKILEIIESILREIKSIKQNKNYQTDIETREFMKRTQNFKKKQKQNEGPSKLHNVWVFTDRDDNEGISRSYVYKANVRYNEENKKLIKKYKDKNSYPTNFKDVVEEWIKFWTEESSFRSKDEEKDEILIEIQFYKDHLSEYKKTQPKHVLEPTPTGFRLPTSYFLW